MMKKNNCGFWIPVNTRVMMSAWMALAPLI
jgi:hypothetical protein